jgi:hypothetical protein
VAAAVGLLAQHDGKQPAGEDRQPRAAAAPQLWTGTATLLKTPHRELTLCGGAITTSLPPAGCGGAVVRGLDPMTVPGAHRYPNGTIETPSVRLVGTWDGKALTVTEPAVRAEPAQDPATTIPGPSCPEPAGGWGSGELDQSAVERLNTYVSNQPDAGTMRVDSSQRVMTVPFTGDLDRHRAEIAKVYDGPVCVELVAHSARELGDVSSRAMHDLETRGLQLLGGGGMGVEPYVEWQVVAATPEQIRQIESEYDGMLRLRSFLVPTS